jgi:hypothetical protein
VDWICSSKPVSRVVCDPFTTESDSWNFNRI